MMQMRKYRIDIPIDLQKCERLKMFFEKIDEPVYPNTSAWHSRTSPVSLIFLGDEWVTSLTRLNRPVISINEFLAKFDTPWHKEL